LVLNAKWSCDEAPVSVTIDEGDAMTCGVTRRAYQMPSDAPRCDAGIKHDDGWGILSHPPDRARAGDASRTARLQRS